MASNASSASFPGGNKVRSMVILERFVDVIEERNSGGGAIVVYSKEGCIAKFCRFPKVNGLN